MYMNQNHEGKRSVLIYFCYQTDSVVSKTSIVSILQLIMIYHIYDYLICFRCHRNIVDTGSRLPNISDVKTQNVGT